ncbi:mitochondrial carrier [Teratosphaeria nubilosa]|uniref:Mitochondrial carrier n=1 Tax=Teratosphaeria nubilosa TaxID=161662 RepID=A0A6G1LM88_9PEZI|nr:mitochondrial carrier [Teratosphaeria nubilosa]
MTKQATNEAVREIAYGSFAGAVGKIVEYPFDTVKVRLQSQPDNRPPIYTGPLDCFKKSVQKDGFRVGLYRGVSAPMVGAAAETASLFVSYSAAQTLLRSTIVDVKEGDEMPLPALITAGAMSGGITSLILTPIELVKCRMQVSMHSDLDPSLRPGQAASSASNSPFQVIKEVFRREGLRGFWRGQLGTFFRETGGSACWFGGYEATTVACKKRLARLERKAVEDVKLPISQQMLSGAVAGVAYNFLFFPADTIKSKMQTGDFTAVKQTFAQTGREIWRAHGLKGFYRGCGITCARSAPSSALIFTIFENLKTTFG